MLIDRIRDRPKTEILRLCLGKRVELPEHLQGRTAPHRAGRFDEPPQATVVAQPED